MSAYYRPIAMHDPARSPAALRLVSGWCWFDRAERLERGRPAEIVPLSEVPHDILEKLTAPRDPVLGLSLDRPRVMGIINVTPDSFSDGGLALRTQNALAQARAFRRAGTDILDIGGESTRPGAQELPVEDEMSRVERVVGEASRLAPVSIDTRKSAVAAAALRDGARMINDVSGMTFDPEMAGVAARSGASVTLVHAQGTPDTMQDDPRYDDALLDVYDALAVLRDRAVAAGIAREKIVLDPGIGFGKRLPHNLALLRRFSLLHCLGQPLLIGASRKRFIGAITRVEAPRQRLAGSLAVAQAAICQGVQFLRVHDTSQTREAVSMTGALMGVEGWST